jgi:DNA-binding IclR family transcriptional regulator
MARADGKLFDLLADHVCRLILAALIKEPGPLTQQQLIAKLGLSSSTVSRRLGDLEDMGLVERASRRAPYRVVYEKQTRDLMATALEIAASAAARVSLEADTEARELRETHSPETKAPTEVGEAA